MSKFGYFTRSVEHNYEGLFRAGEELYNGDFVSLQADTDGNLCFKKVASDNTMGLRLAAKTTRWRNPAIVVDVVHEGTLGTYMVENEWEVYTQYGDYDTSNYSVPAGHLVKAKMPLKSEQMIIAVDETAYASLDVGDSLKIVNGAIVAA